MGRTRGMSSRRSGKGLENLDEEVVEEEVIEEGIRTKMKGMGRRRRNRSRKRSMRSGGTCGG